jgi:hypothetical protein
MEIVGLLVIVILIVMIIFFSLLFMTRDEGPENLLTFRDKELAKQIGIVISETTVECSNTNRRLRDLIEDCAISKEITCGTEGNSCQKLNLTIEQILAQTLAIDLEYFLIITGLDDQVITNFTTDFCNTPRASFDTTTTQIPTMSGSLRLRVGLCY